MGILLPCFWSNENDVIEFTLTFITANKTHTPFLCIFNGRILETTPEVSLLFLLVKLVKIHISSYHIHMSSYHNTYKYNNILSWSRKSRTFRFWDVSNLLLKERLMTSGPLMVKWNTKILKLQCIIYGVYLS